MVVPGVIGGNIVVFSGTERRQQGGCVLMSGCVPGLRLRQ